MNHDPQMSKQKRWAFAAYEKNLCGHSMVGNTLSRTIFAKQWIKSSENGNYQQKFEFRLEK